MNGFSLWIVVRDRKLADAWHRLLSRECLIAERLETLAALETCAEGGRGVALLELGRDELNDPRKLKDFLAVRPGVSIIVVGPKSAAGPKVEAGVLEAGADDFITTGVDERVLLAKIKAHLRRLSPGLECLRALVRSKNGELEVDRVRRVIRTGTKNKKVYSPDRFTPKEFDILAILVGREEHVVSRGFFMEEIWKEKTGCVNCETIDKHVEALRHKLGVYGRNIRSVYGSGYVYKAG